MNRILLIFLFFIAGQVLRAQVYCATIDSVPAIPPHTGMGDTLTGPISGVFDFVWSSHGTIIYTAYDSTGNGQYVSIPASDSFWINYDGISGPLKRTSVWTPVIQDHQSAGFTICLNIPIDKDYYIGLGFDNYGTLIIDSKVIIQQAYTGGTENLGVWKIYKIHLLRGIHFLQVIGTNYDDVAALGCEIYDNSMDEIENAHSYNDLNVVFSTMNEHGKPNVNGDSSASYTCPVGYALDYCTGGVPECGRIITDTVDMSVTNPPPVCNSPVDITSSEIIAGSSPGLTYSYWKDSGTTISLSDPNAVDSSGIYFIKATSPDGDCSAVRPVIINIRSASADTIQSTICQGQNYAGHTLTGIYKDTFNAVNGCDSIRTLNLSVNGYSYSSITTSICQGQNYNGYTTGGIYIDTLTGVNGCDSFRTLNLSINPLQITHIDSTVCSGQKVYGHATAGIYSDTFPAVNTCDSIIIINLNVVPKPEPYLGGNFSLCPGDSLKLNPGTFSSYLWQDSSTMNYFIAKQPGLYSVIVSDNNVCDSAQAEVYVEPKNCNILMPSAFTPNHDGLNDIFRLKYPFQIEQFEMAVFNRIGQRMYYTTNLSEGWDGTFNGASMPAGTYVWTISLSDAQGVKQKANGTVVLIR